MCQMFHQSYSIILVLMIPTQKSINQHLSATPRHPIIHHQVITSMREIWSPRPPISMSSQSPATGTWAWASQWGGRKKKKLVAQSHEQFFFFRPSPSPGKEPGRAIIHHQVITSMREIWSPRPPISMSSQSPATGAWAWASQWGGEKKKNWLPTPTSNSFFSSPPSRGGGRQAQLLEIEDSLRVEALETRSPS